MMRSIHWYHLLGTVMFGWRDIMGFYGGYGVSIEVIISNVVFVSGDFMMVLYVTCDEESIYAIRILVGLVILEILAPPMLRNRKL